MITDAIITRSSQCWNDYNISIFVDGKEIVIEKDGMFNFKYYEELKHLTVPIEKPKPEPLPETV